MVVAALTVVLAAVVVGVLVQTRRAAGTAIERDQHAIQVAAVQQRTVDVLSAVMAERGRVELFGSTSDEARSARSAVDEAAARLDSELSSLDARVRERTSLSGLTTLLGQIDDIRGTSTPGESYTIAVTAIATALRDSNLAITSGAAIANRRQFSALLDLLTAVGQQRRLVGLIVIGDGDQSTATALLVTRQRAEAARAQFEDLSDVGSEALDRIRDLHGSVDALATQVKAGEGSDVDLDEWWVAATAEIDAVRAEMADLMMALVDERSSSIDAAKNERTLEAGAVAATIGIVVLVAIGAAAAIAERRRAALEYQQLADGIEARLGEPPMMASAAVVAIDRVGRSLRYQRAGHPPPLVRRQRDNSVEVLDGAANPLLRPGIERTRPDVSVPLGPGDTLILYTDGLIERRGEVITDSIAEFARCVAEGPTDLDALVEALVSRADHCRDDVALLVVRLAR